VVGGDEQRVRDGADGLLEPAMAQEPPIARGEGTVPRAGGGERCLDQRGPERDRSTEHMVGVGEM